MKKLLALALTLLLALCALPALGDALPVYTLLTTQDDPVVVGIGTQILGKNMLLTALPDVLEDAELIATDGETVYLVERVVDLDGVCQLLQLDRETDMEPLELMADEAQFTVCLGLTSELETVQAEPDMVQQTLYRGVKASEMTLTADLMPGAFLTDGFALQSLVVARWSEGQSRYIVVDAQELQRLIHRAAGGSSFNWISSDVAITVDGCTATVDWSKLDFTGCGAEDKIWIYASIGSNRYFERVAVPISDGSVMLTVAPGQPHTLWIYAGPEASAPLDDQAVSVQIVPPVGERFTDYDYADAECYLGYSAKDDIVDAAHKAAPLTEPTAELLGSAQLWLQAESTYRVTEKVDLDGCIVLTTPDGCVLCAGCGFVLEPAMGASDVWAAPINEMLDTYLDFYEAFASGEYTLCYYYGNQPVTQLTFTLP